MRVRPAACVLRANPRDGARADRSTVVALGEKFGLETSSGVDRANGSLAKGEMRVVAVLAYSRRPMQCPRSLQKRPRC